MIMFASSELKDKRLADQLLELAAYVKQAAVDGIAAHEVELTLFRGVMKRNWRHRLRTGAARWNTPRSANRNS
jgi:hypothetical protein